MYQAGVTDIPEDCPDAVRAFIEEGVYSMPCGFYKTCKQWAFFRQGDGFMHGANMQDAWQAVNWHRTSGRHKYFMCPKCNQQGAPISV